MSVIARRSVFAMLASLCALAGALMCWGASARAAFVHPYLSQVTEVPASSGAAVTGPFGNPENLAFGTSGDLYVSDNTSGVVDEFDSSGDFISPQIGNGVLGHKFERSLAVNHATGEVYVADSEVDVVYAFSAAGVLLETWHGTDAPSGSFGGGYVHIAMDNSTSLSDPTAGDVYVSDSQDKVVDLLKPEAGGKEKYLTQLTGVGAPGGFATPFELAVDEANGELLVANNLERVDIFMPVLGGYEYVRQLTGPPGGSFVEIGSVAVEASSGEIYVADTTAKAVDQFSATGVFEGEITGPAVGAFAEPLGVAVTEGGDVYVADGAAQDVDVFGPRVVVPDVTVGPASNETNTSATLSGTVDPDGVAMSSCRFKYGTSTSYGQSIPCAQTPAQIGSGGVPVSVDATLTGLLASTTYHFRLDGSNANGTNFTRDATFTTTGPPAVVAESFSNVGTTTASVSAHVDPGGRPTTYEVEYGTSTAYGATTPAISVGGESGDTAVSTQLSGLQSGALYHFRVVASNEYGLSHGADTTFTTFSPTDSTLPDGRVYEAVSPVETEGNANVYVPFAGSGYLGTNGEHGINSGEPFEVSSDGKAVVYPGDLPSTGGGGQSGFGSGDQYLATLSDTGGWTVTSISPVGDHGAHYEAFSSDLTVGVLESGVSLAPEAPPGALYSHVVSGGGYKSLYTRQATGHILYAGSNVGTSDVSAMSHILVEAVGASLLEGEGNLEKELEEGIAGEGKKAKVLYDSVGGRLSLVSILPDGTVDADASFGSLPSSNNTEAPGLSHAISADGSRIFWTDKGTDDLYVRENDASPDASTVQVDESVGGGGVFWGASEDGSKAFFTKGDLYEYDVDSGRTTDLTPGVEVLGVAGASDDGQYIYYVDSDYGLNLWHDGVNTFIATLSAKDGNHVVPYEDEFDRVGGWERASGFRTAEVTPDGHSLLFMSGASLTGYDNEEKGVRADEVFLYEAGSSDLRCVSCSPTGEPPAPTEFDNYKFKLPIGGFFPITMESQALAQPRVISEDGSRVFFDTGEPLVPQDVNGWLDVYEWERNGTGSCRESRGCVYLLSGGTSSENSYLLGASANGDGAFVITRAQLLARDRNDNDDVYDARVGGAQPPPVPSCSGSGCQGVPPTAPIFATPSSATFNGVGNFLPPSKSGAKPRKKSQKAKQCKRGLVRKHGKCVRKAKKSTKGRKQHV
jgi:Fibronectin type III domain